MRRSPEPCRNERSLRSRLVVAVVATVLAVSVVACGGDSVSTAGSGSDRAGADVAATVPTAGGGQFSFGDLVGSPALLWFWAPW